MRWGGEVTLNLGESVTYVKKSYKSEQDYTGNWTNGYGIITYVSNLKAEDSGLPFYYFVAIDGDTENIVAPNSDCVWGGD